HYSEQMVIYKIQMEKLFWSHRDEKILISIFVFCHRIISRRNFSFLLVEGNDIQSDFSLPAHIKIPHTYFSGSVIFNHPISGR
ncbi:hypothetical protein JTY81_15530, partial [Citrobacter freundii]|nr:hypothetical protein [Citrobacter freundii]